MVIRLAALVICLLIFADTARGTAPPRPGCLACHPVHHAEKGSCTSCHRGNAATLRKNIAHYFLIAGKYAGFTLGETAQVREGRELMEQLACRRCHLSAGKGNRLATSLDGLFDKRETGEVADAIKYPAQAMPDFRLDEGRISAIVNAVLSGAKSAPQKERERPVSVHFRTSTGEAQDIFSKKCGPCHRALTEGRGLLGTGEIGPNLSGLLSRYYPQNFPGNKRWTVRRLRSWIGNPREIKANTQMQPVPLDERRFRELLAVLGAVEN